MDALNQDPPLIAILGPTASGKSALALALAERLEGEIVNYDSLQLYRGFEIGTGKLPPAERRGIPHHLLDIVNPGEVFTAGNYRSAALNVLQSLRERGKLPILAGGTGLYLRALMLGLFEGPSRSERLRARLKSLQERQGKRGDYLHRMLRRLDPGTAARIHPRDTQKIVRALEVCFLAGQPMSTMLGRGRKGLQGFRLIKVGLSPDRGQLRDRINRRVEQMFAAGLMSEVQAALDRSVDTKILGALGYRQACAALRGEIRPKEAIPQTQAATRQYAKRQMTWFRKEADVRWYPGFGDDPQVQRQVLEWLGTLFN